MKEKKNRSLPLWWLALCLTLLFCVLKVYGVIAWSWVWIFAPLWITLALSIFCSLVVMIVLLVIVQLSETKKNKFR